MRNIICQPERIPYIWKVRLLILINYYAYHISEKGDNLEAQVLQSKVQCCQGDRKGKWAFLYESYECLSLKWKGRQHGTGNDAKWNTAIKTQSVIRVITCFFTFTCDETGESFQFFPYHDQMFWINLSGHLGRDGSSALPTQAAHRTEQKEKNIKRARR